MDPKVYNNTTINADHKQRMAKNLVEQLIKAHGNAMVKDLHGDGSMVDLAEIYRVRGK
jgi:hypothetical protein